MNALPWRLAKAGELTGEQHVSENHHRGRVGVAIVCAGGCTPSIEDTAAAQNPYPKSSPLHAPFDRMVRKLATDPRYLEVARATVEEGGNLADRNIRLAVQGMRALDDDALLSQMEILTEALGKADDAACALLGFPTPGDELDIGKLMLAQLEKLPQDRIDTWFDVSYQATIAGISGKPPYAASPLMAEAGLRQVIDGMSEDGRQRLKQIMSRGGATYADKCWAARMMFKRTLKLPEKERAAVIRSLVAPPRS